MSNQAESIVHRAIARSIESSAVDHIRNVRSVDTLDGVATELEILADDYVEIKVERRAEYWGTDDDGAEWRVHLHW
jgi:hypothetical protein